MIRMLYPLLIACIALGTPLPTLADGNLKLVASVHRQFAQYAYRTDRSLYGKRDYWATPAELRTRGAGDCEDFALAKYAELRERGLERTQMRFAYLVIEEGGSHMVLLYTDAADTTWVLDNRSPHILFPVRDIRDRIAFRFDLERLYWNHQGERHVRSLDADSGYGRRVDRWAERAGMS